MFRPMTMVLLSCVLLLSACRQDRVGGGDDGVGDAATDQVAADDVGDALETDTPAPDGEVDTGSDTLRADLEVSDTQADTRPPEDTTSDVVAPRCPVAPPDEPGVVATEQGLVRGVEVGQTRAYRGIPYAAPPVGALRWAPPAAPDCSAGVFDAADFGPRCAQVALDGAISGREDCLTLNVWAPLQPPPTPRAVMVFIHGGGNQVGQSADPGDGDDLLFNGRVFVEREDVVFVTLNYRLGALGFLALPALSADSPLGVSGNYGLQDQLAALRWIRTNIAAFGGDPSRVMVFGESAGAFDTCALLASPLSEGLFHRALMQSGNCQVPTLAERQALHASWAAPLGCDTDTDAACLRALDVDVLLATQGGLTFELQAYDEALPWGPVVDGYVLPASPHDALRSGAHLDIPFVIGTNADEMTFFLLLSNITQQMFLDFIDLVFGPGHQAELLQYYDRTGLEAWRRPAIELTTDLLFTCEARRVARWAAASQSSPVYRYYLTWFVDNAVGRPIGATHALELPLLFQAGHIGTYDLTASELAMADQLLRYWARFAITGDPNGGGDPGWPEYVGQTDPYLQIDDPVAARQGVDTAECDLLDALLGF